MTYEEVMKKAKSEIGPYCKVCPQCNGKACKNQMPGPGAKGVGDVAIRNYDAWKDIRINMDTICENVTPDTSIELFGEKFDYPFFAGPVGAMKLHYGDKYDDLTYNDILVSACAANGIAAFTGDGTNPDVFKAATAAIKKNHGQGIPTVKPWNIETNTVFVDPLHESMDALSVAYALLKSHEVIDLLIIMLGTNDVKERFGANAACIGAGMERLLLKAKSVDCWGGKAPNILVVAPPCIKDGFHDAVMGAGCVEKSRGVAEQLRIVAERQGVHFMDAAECEFNEVDFMHLTCKGHARLAELLGAEVPKLI